ncbi:MAG: hypothetical protein ABSC51_06150 [Gaiellaceae bacterium]|jgi:hypothetical protein
MSARPDHLDAVRIPSGQATGQQLRGIAEHEVGRHWLRWALRWSGWPAEFRDDLEEYARTRAPLIYRGWRREQKGEI